MFVIGSLYLYVFAIPVELYHLGCSAILEFSAILYPVGERKGYLLEGGLHLCILGNILGHVRIFSGSVAPFYEFIASARNGQNGLPIPTRSYHLGKVAY